MKFIHYIKNVSGVDIMGVFSLLVFVAFFIGVSIWVFKMKKSRLDKISRIPIDN
ncbi:MAG: cbb3-type cytochrome c oxidase subunit 3 [Chitinophagaceae bacterium]|nr:cbb3-type cytochrome c oxidase subunit 3 [Bacteroidota bacterium]MCC6256976.1 cbb3-type cytochrome c oxidase subunit 3 [Chitinophagaceae bacterium]MCW5916337.1 cbb3-type cytochrome c oxidase subunit 3 [Ferruginibacter sp.]